MKFPIVLALLTISLPALAQPTPTTNPIVLNTLLFPGSATQGLKQYTMGPPPNCQLLHLTTATGDAITAFFGPATTVTGDPDPNANLRPSFIYFYGNGSCIAISGFEFNRFRRLGVNVLLPDYAGYGMSGGKPSEESLFATADACYDYIAKTRRVDPHKIIAAGWSLGAAVATDLATRKKVAALVLFNPFTNITDMAHVMFPFLPATATVVYPFDNLKKIPQVKVPIFICNGLHDELVPPSMTAALTAAAGGPVTHDPIAAADHSTIFTADPAAVFGPLREFVAKSTAR